MEPSNFPLRTIASSCSFIAREFLSSERSLFQAPILDSSPEFSHPTFCRFGESHGKKTYPEEGEQIASVSFSSCREWCATCDSRRFEACFAASDPFSLNNDLSAPLEAPGFSLCLMFGVMPSRIGCKKFPANQND